MRSRIGTAVVVAALALGGSVATIEPAAAAGAHTVTVTPSTGLADGQTVTVSGTGFVETPIVNDWSVAMCDPGIIAGITLENALQHCDVTTQPFAFTHADAAGNLSTPYAVRKSFNTSSGAVTCGQKPSDCVILLAQLTDQGFVGATASISFGTPTRTLADCIREFLNDHQRGLRFRFYRLLVCVFAVLTQHRPH